MRKAASLSLFLAFLWIAVGCQRADVEFPAKAPRPVSVIRLQRSIPPSTNRISGSVQSWKTERIGFEVAGKLDWVLEPGKNVDGDIRDAEGSVIQLGTPLAKIDDTSFQVVVETARADLEVAKLDQEVAAIRLNDTLPRDIESAEADLKLAEAAYDRERKLQQRNAGSQAALDEARTRKTTQGAQLANLRSSLKQARAEWNAAKARVTRAEQNLRNAERDLANTTLHASYSGQISTVDVVPGSIVSAGSPILTLQMMNPIKIEIEVSAAQSRLLQRQRQVKVIHVRPDGSIDQRQAMVHSVDPSANPATRTFTVTILIINNQNRPAAPSEVDEGSVARCEQIWPLDLGAIVNGDTDALVVEDGAIFENDGKSYVWLLANARFGEPLPAVLKVEKTEVLPSGLRVSFLGNWIFQKVSFVDESIDADSVVTGKLSFKDVSEEKWDGESVILDSGMQWALRPGDLVSVELGHESFEPGFYLPADAIYEDRGQTFVFVAKDGAASKTAVSVAIPKNLNQGSMLRVEPTGSSSLTEDDKIIVGGVHYLSDGDSIRIVSSPKQETTL